MPLTIEEVEDLLSRAYHVRLPEYLVFLDKPLLGFAGKPVLISVRLNEETGTIILPGKVALLGGLYPKGSDVVFLTPQATGEVLLHELVHYTWGVGERLAHPLGRLMDIKNRLSLGLRRREVHYKGVGEFKEFQKFGIRDPPSGRSRCYQLRKLKQETDF